MAHTASKFYSVMVVGNNPEELMEKYRIGLKVEKYLKYKYLDAEKMQKNSIKIFSQMINDYKSFNLTKYQVDILSERLKAIKNMTPFEFYQIQTQGCSYDDEGNAWSDKNPNGKWNNYQKGNHFSIPLILKNGQQITSCPNEEIDWSKMHRVDEKFYERVWDLVHGLLAPETEDDDAIMVNMSNKENYFSNFKDKEDYVLRNTSYWNYAYLDENGWIDLDDSKNDTEWIKNFYNKFIKKLNPTDRVTIFECTKNSDEED